MKPETSTRLALHAHHNVLQPALQAGRIDRLLVGEEAARVLALVERLMCGALPDGWSAERRGSSLAAVPPAGVVVHAVDGRAVAAACLPDLDAPRAELDAHVARNAAELQVHAHTHRCRKGGYKGTDDSCAMAYPRVLHSATSNDGGVVRVRLDVGSLVFYVPAVMLASPCNHTIGMGIEQSRWARQMDLHLARVARGEAQAEDAPRPQSLHEASIDGSFYMCKYTCKADNQDAHGEFLTLATEPRPVRYALEFSREIVAASVIVRIRCT